MGIQATFFTENPLRGENGYVSLLSCLNWSTIIMIYESTILAIGCINVI